MSQGGGVGVKRDLLGQDVQVDLLATADPVVGPALVLVLDHAGDVSLPDSVEESTETP